MNQIEELLLSEPVVVSFTMFWNKFHKSLYYNDNNHRISLITCLSHWPSTDCTFSWLSCI